MRTVTKALRRKFVSLALLATWLSGCSSWRVESVSPAELLATKKPDVVRVTPAAGDDVVLRTPAIVRDTLRGWWKGGEQAIALTDVSAIATRHADAGKSVLLGVGIAVGVFATAAIYCAASDGCFSFNFNPLGSGR